jgi:PKD repeat protein
MIKPFLQVSAFMLLSLNVLFAQNRVIDPTNTRDGESVEYCITHKKMNVLNQDPEYRKSREIAEEELKERLANKASVPKATVYKIPIVFHVLHNNGAENISDEQILDQVAILNRDFRRLNIDADNVQSVFQGMPTDVEVEFVLATKAPNGTCFKGITRTVSSLTFDGSDGGAQVDAIVSGNDVYNGQWAGNKYLNVFVVAEAGGAAGYTTNPSSWSATLMDNGIWILHDYVGSIGTSNVQTSRAMTHEVGHWLDLSHTWGGNNNPGNASSCGTDDDVDDTPNCIGVTSCNLNANTCTAVDPFFGTDVKDNVENYMDYSYCSKMFTQGQVDRMRAALMVNSTGRSNLWTTNNLNQTGATGTTYLCKAQFTSNKTSVCLGDSIEFSDDSYNAVTGWNWTFEGGSPASSTEQNPVVTYTTPGVYTVTLAATDGTNSDSEIKTGYVRVLPTSGSLPFFEGFENYSTLSNLTNWEVFNGNGNNTFVLDNTIGHSGTKCAKLINFGQSGSNIDALIASPVDLGSVSSQGGQVTLSFRYAYRKKTSADLEYLKVFVTNDCGGNWVQRKTLSGNALGTSTSTTSWAPSSVSDWVTVHMINITSEYWVDNFRYKFQFEGNGGNNFYLDDINIYLGAPSDEIVLGLIETGEIQDLNLYPNPTDKELNLRFSVSEPQQTFIQITDISGKQVELHAVNAASGANLVMIDAEKYAAGSYLMTISTQSGRKVLPFVVK